MVFFYLAEIGVMMWILIASNLLSGRELSALQLSLTLRSFHVLISYRNDRGVHFIPRTKDDRLVRQLGDCCILIHLGPLPCLR